MAQYIQKCTVMSSLFSMLTVLGQYMHVYWTNTGPVLAHFIYTITLSKFYKGISLLVQYRASTYNTVKAYRYWASIGPVHTKLYGTAVIVRYVTSTGPIHACLLGSKTRVVYIVP